MKCDQAAPYLPASVDELDAVTAAAVAEHVAGCAACAAESRRYEGIRAALAVTATREAKPPADLVPAILARTSVHPRLRPLPLAPLAPELVRAIQENRDVLVPAAGAALVAAGAAWALWRGVRSLLRADPQRA